MEDHTLSNKKDNLIRRLREELVALKADNTWRCPYGTGHDVDHLEEGKKRLLDMKDSAMSNMSHYISRLENQLTSKQRSIASNGAAAPLLNARDQYIRAGAWKKACKAQEVLASYMPEYDTDPPPDYDEAARLLKLAEDLEKD